ITVEVRASPSAGDPWLLVMSDVTTDRQAQRLVEALQRAASAARAASSVEELGDSIVRVLAEHDLRSRFQPADGGQGATRHATDADKWLQLRVEDRILVIESPAGAAADAVDAFERDVLSAVERLQTEERLREANLRLANAVTARTADLEGLYAYSRDLAEAESEEEAARVAVAHLSAALDAPAAAVLCLGGRHVGAGSAGKQARAEDILLELEPDEHSSCRRLLRLPITEAAADVAKALTPTSRGNGLLTVELHDAGNEQLKLLLTHSTQLGATLDRLGIRQEAEGSRLRSIADVVDEGIAIVDLEGTIEPENAAAEVLLAALTQSEGQYDGQLDELISSARDTNAAVEREIIVGGRTLLAAARAIPASPGRVALTLRDVTEQRLTQERLSQAERLAALGQLVSGVAHELNNPLTGILGFAQLLQDEPLDDDARRSVETIQSEAERAGKIIQDLLSFARRREPRRGPVDVDELLSRVLNIRAYDMQSEGVNVELDLAADLPPVDGDGDQLQQVFFNVLTNALQAVRMTPSPRRISVATSGNADEVRVRLSDSGPGIPPEALGRIFEPFFTTKEPGEGTGLGLSISYGIVQEHGGSIAVRNEPSGGVSVEITLPARRQAAEADDDQADDTATTGRARILVADDEESIRAVLLQMLAGDGHEVVTAEDGAQALAALSRQDFDLVITDLKMPEISGQELYAEIQASNPELARRVIFITGDTLNEQTRAFVDSLDNPTLEKPFRLERLRALISQVLA
ncbi:MAG TPA: ATP-binding protein, partial [Dehalococcoidia bacterium]|nr:ATP-binding protein [Dehalococcoidia bacterium]